MAKKQTEKITALYGRLSRDDDQAGDSNSIVQQTRFICSHAISVEPEAAFQMGRHVVKGSKQECVKIRAAVKS